MIFIKRGHYFIILCILVLFISSCSDPTELTSVESYPSSAAEFPPTSPTLPPTELAGEQQVTASPTVVVTEIFEDPLDTEEVLEIADPRSDDLKAYLEALANNGQFMGSVLIARDGSILLNQGFGYADLSERRPNTPQTQFRIASITKQFTAAAILKLQAQGLLSVNDPVSKFIPEYPNGDQITIHQLLTNSSGIPNYEDMPNLPQIAQSPITLDELINTFAGQSLAHPPGRNFTYSSSGYVLLTKIIEIVSEQPYAMYLKNQLFLPSGMNDSGYDFLAPDVARPAISYRLGRDGPQPAIVPDTSWLSGAGAVYSTTEDMYRWEKALGDGQFLDSKSLEAMYSPWINIGTEGAYGYGWQISEMFDRPTAFHGGAIFGVGSFLLKFLEDDVFIVVLGNGTQVPPRQIATDLARIIFLD